MPGVRAVWGALGGEVSAELHGQLLLVEASFLGAASLALPLSVPAEDRKSAWVGLPGLAWAGWSDVWGPRWDFFLFFRSFVTLK